MANLEDKKDLHISYDLYCWLPVSNITGVLNIISTCGFAYKRKLKFSSRQQNNEYIKYWEHP